MQQRHDTVVQFFFFGYYMHAIDLQERRRQEKDSRVASRLDKCLEPGAKPTISASVPRQHR